MTQNLFFHKKILIQKVFEKAKIETKQASFSGVLKDLEIILRDEYNIPLSYKTFENYYKAIVEENRDYKIRPETLDELSVYLNEDDFDSFCLKYPVKKEGIDISVTENAEQVFSDSLHRVIINITNSPVFNLPEFVSKHRNSLGIMGILLIGGILFNNKGFTPRFYTGNETLNSMPAPRSRECMYWNGNQYLRVFCDDKSSGNKLIPYSREMALMKKINRPDTLNAENALDKVWYSKNHNRVEFFNAPGLDPETGKTLKSVTKYIIEKYIVNKKKTIKRMQ